jgi:uncharacterized damage-inducible protein DinB
VLRGASEWYVSVQLEGKPYSAFHSRARAAHKTSGVREVPTDYFVRGSLRKNVPAQQPCAEIRTSNLLRLSAQDGFVSFFMVPASAKENNMSEIQRIEDQYRCSFEGEAWAGPSLRELLQGIKPAQAAAHPIQGLHSIAEIIGHIITWQDVFAQRLAGKVVNDNDVPEEVNFPPMTEPSEAAWTKMKEKLDQSCRQMLETIPCVPESRLDEKVPGKPYTFYFMLHGIIQHNLYHAGQIAILRKA